MSCKVFEGAAGCGKTRRLLECARELLHAHPLKPGQRLLATTYMHGARRKLDQALRVLPALRGQYECSTLDSVALRWVSRWRSLAARIGYDKPNEGDFDATCALAAHLLATDGVAKWVAAAYPLILIDEAQDLTADRLAIVQRLGQHAEVFVAGDEFQCLQPALRPNPFEEWARAMENTETLTRIWRTDELELLTAARSLRNGKGPISGKAFQIRKAPSSALAGGHIVNAIAWYSRNGTVAVLAPTFTSNYVLEAVNWARTNRTSKGFGPVLLFSEAADHEEARELRAALALEPEASIDVVAKAVEELPSRRVAMEVSAWVATQRNALGRRALNRGDVERAIDRALANRRRFSYDSGHRLTATTIHAAKNREFDGVIILWPYQVGGSDDQKRRLLYNAITRAKRWAVVVVQGAKICEAPPFC